MESAVKDGIIPQDLPIIAKVEELRDWNDPPLCSWSSFSVAAPSGRNADLRRRFDKILPAFVKLQTGRKIRGEKPPKTKSIGDWLLEDELDALRRQNADLIIRTQQAEAAARANNSIIESLRADNAELTAKLARIAPLQRTK